MNWTLVGFILSVLCPTIYAQAAGLSECVVPLPICPNPNITFWLYTRDTINNPYELSVARPETIRDAVFIPGNEFKLLVHGYTGHKDYDPNTDLRPAYLQLRDMNIITIDYGPIVRSPCYFQAVTNVPLISMCAAQFLDELIQTRNISISNIHVVGLSLGAHVSGGLSNYLKSGTIERVTGLDPALPLFISPDNRMKLDKTDAKFVDVIHTDVLQRGKLEYLGHLDHFVNGGKNQKGCEQYTNMTMSECSHWRSVLYFAESINAPDEMAFYGAICSSWFLYKLGLCSKDSPEVIMGHFATKPEVHTIGFVEINSNSPFGRGPRKTGVYRGGSESYPSSTNNEIQCNGEDCSPDTKEIEQLEETNSNPKVYADMDYFHTRWQNARIALDN